MSNGWAGRDNAWVVSRLASLLGQHQAPHGSASETAK
jgi:hypothetical protein